MNTSLDFSISEVIALIIVTLLGILVSVIAHVPILFGFFPGLLFLIVLCKRKGVQRKKMIEIGVNGVAKTKEVVIILLLVSIVLPAWGVSGTIEQLVTFVLHFLSVDHFILLSFVFTLLISMLLGTAVGSLSAIGLPIMGAASAIGMPLEVVAGALVSGAFVGDRTSPFSSANQLLASTVEAPVFHQFRKMLLTTALGILVSLIFYFVMDFTIAESRSFHNEIYRKKYNFNWYSLISLIPPVMLLLLVFFRWKIKYAFIVSIVTALIIASIEGNQISYIAEQLWHGSEQVGGGIKNMLLVVLFIAMAGFYIGLLEELRIIQPILDRWLSTSITLLGSTLKTMIAALFISVIACNQTLPIILTGRSFLSHWKQHFGKGELARVIADSSMLFPGMIPWSILAIMCSTIVGVPVMAFLPYAIFLWILPILTVALSLIRQSSSGNREYVVNSY